MSSPSNTSTGHSGMIHDWMFLTRRNRRPRKKSTQQQQQQQHQIPPFHNNSQQQQQQQHPSSTTTITQQQQQSIPIEISVTSAPSFPSLDMREVVMNGGGGVAYDEDYHSPTTSTTTTTTATSDHLSPVNTTHQRNSFSGPIPPISFLSSDFSAMDVNDEHSPPLLTKSHENEERYNNNLRVENRSRRAVSLPHDYNNSNSNNNYLLPSIRESISLLAEQKSSAMNLSSPLPSSPQHSPRQQQYSPSGSPMPISPVYAPTSPRGLSSPATSPRYNHRYSPIPTSPRHHHNPPSPRHNPPSPRYISPNVSPRHHPYQQQPPPLLESTEPVQFVHAGFQVNDISVQFERTKQRIQQETEQIRSHNTIA